MYRHANSTSVKHAHYLHASSYMPRFFRPPRHIAIILTYSTAKVKKIITEDICIFDSDSILF